MTIRLLDPPLHEFLPEGDLEQIVSELTADTGTTEEEVYARIEKLSEVNPMLGFRGCRYTIITGHYSIEPIYKLLEHVLPTQISHDLYRLGISYPELSEMQVRAILQAAISLTNQGVTVYPEIMVPLVGTPQARRVSLFPHHIFLCSDDII